MEGQTLEVLCATMHQHDFQKLTEMNISSDVVFANQSNFTGYAETYCGPFRARMLSTQTRGVGRNRNLALTHAEGDILLFADDDIRYTEDYREGVLRAYARRPDADVIIFSMDITREGQVIRQIKAPDRRLWLWNSLRYGTYVVSVRRNSLEHANIWFSLRYGGGTEHAHGEDTLFLRDVFRKKLRVYGSKYCLGTCSKDQSTCFHGYDHRYFFDQGFLYAEVFGVLAKAAALRFCLKKRKNYRGAMSVWGAFSAFLEGIHSARKEDR